MRRRGVGGRPPAWSFLLVLVAFTGVVVAHVLLPLPSILVAGGLVPLAIPAAHRSRLS